MKWIVCMVFLFVSVGAFAQQERQVRLLEDENLIEAVYYYEDGTISQKGTFNLDGALHGTWESFNAQGEKVSIGLYENGQRQGKWFFWAADELREVDYADNAIASVHVWKEGTRLAFQE